MICKDWEETFFGKNYVFFSKKKQKNCSIHEKNTILPNSGHKVVLQVHQHIRSEHILPRSLAQNQVTRRRTQDLYQQGPTPRSSNPSRSHRRFLRHGADPASHVNNFQEKLTTFNLGGFSKKVSSTKCCRDSV